MFKKRIAAAIATHTPLEEDAVSELLETPPSPDLGDFAFPCFSLAKELKKSPQAIAQGLAPKVSDEIISHVEAAGPYCNVFLEREPVVERVVREALKDGFGSGQAKSEKVMIEYSQPNTHKAFHVGHIRGTALGEALARILRHDGYEVVQANYSGDSGMHVAKWLWCYQEYHAGEEPPTEGRGRWLANLYVEAVKRLEDDPAQEERVRELNKRLDDGSDEALNALWSRTREWSLAEFKSIYSELNAHFDVWWFEREMDSRAKELSQELLDKGVAEESDGAIIMDLEDVKKSVWVLLRSDGTPLYSAKDLALAEKKFTEYAIDRSIYVVGQAQALHLEQLFETLKRMGFSQWKRCSHLGYEEVRLPEGKMSSRTGKNIIYDDMREQVFTHTREEIVKRHPEWDDDQVGRVVRAVGVCALKFEMIMRDHNKPIIYEVERVCDFEGDTGPYVQYTHARCASILKKLSRTPSGESRLSGDHEFLLAKEVLRFPTVVESIGRSLEPGLLAHYVIGLCKAFNSFYHECKVVGDEREDARASLVLATKRTIGLSLELLGVDAPNQM